MQTVIRKFTPRFFISAYHFLFAFLGALRYGFPSRDLIVIGVTGTNGKSTTVEMAAQILREAGYKTASFSSIRFQIGEQVERNTLKMTMPGRFHLQRLLWRAAKEQCQYVVMEVTSEGILQHRHRFINFHTAVFTNLSPEHIERHGSFEQYKKEKGKLFRATKQVHVINIDDEHAEYFLKFPAKHVMSYGTKNEAAVKAEHIQENQNGISFTIQGVQFSLAFPGAFNAHNALAAVCVGVSQGIAVEQASKALSQMKGVPGRMEEVISEPYRVVVDYAFTPAALEKVYQSLKPQQAKLICVLGAAGGGRDKWKRSVLGEIASRYCDNIFITDEDPYEENPREIMEQVAAGANGKATIIEDRRVAIRRALQDANSGDVVVVTGKGSEDSIAVAGAKKIPWDDREVIKEEATNL